MDMKKAVTYLETGSTDPAYNLAFEEAVLENRREGDILILWQNKNTIVIGQNQNAEEEINRRFVEENDIKVVRRRTGGGAVYHDLGNINYSFITDSGIEDHFSLERFTTPVVKVLKDLGLSAEASGRNDILVDGRKVSGTAQRLSGTRILHHGTLLFESDPAMIAGALNVSKDKFISKSAKSVKSRIGNIRPYLKEDMSIDDFRDYLISSLAGSGMVTGSLTDEEIKEVKRLKTEKYDTWNWTYGRSPKFDFRNKRRFDGGSVDVQASVRNGVTHEIKFYGDFLSLTSLNDIETGLIGIPFDRSSYQEYISSFDLKKLFGSITSEEILETIFSSD